jgi:two-component system, sensor histidine kinase and response regulator
VAPAVFWLNLLSDAVIALSYYSIPFILLYFAMRRRDLVFRWMFVMFGIFILGCGTTHVMGIWTLWNPDYGVDGLVKALTALVSIATAIMLWPLVPQALALPSPGQLARANHELNREIGERRQAEAAARRLNDELEERVRARTAELEAANERLRQEVEERRHAEERLAAGEQRSRQVIELIREALGTAVKALRPDVPILYTSGFSESSVQDDRAHAASRHFLPKPYRKRDPAQKLQQLLSEG